MKSLIYLCFVSLLLSCNKGNSNEKNASESKEDKEVLLDDVKPDKITHLKIQGMTCEMGCGGAIRKNLKKELKVSKVEFDFVPDRISQTCRVLYNSQHTTDAEIIDLIETINDQQFRVNKDSTVSLTI